MVQLLTLLAISCLFPSVLAQNNTIASLNSTEAFGTEYPSSCDADCAKFLLVTNDCRGLPSTADTDWCICQTSYYIQFQICGQCIVSQNPHSNASEIISTSLSGIEHLCNTLTLPITIKGLVETGSAMAWRSQRLSWIGLTVVITALRAGLW